MEKTTKKTSTQGTKAQAPKKVAKSTTSTASKSSKKEPKNTSPKVAKPKNDIKKDEKTTLKIAPRENPAKAKRAKLNPAKESLQNSAVVENSAKNLPQNKEISKSNITNTKLISALKVIENISHTLGISDRERINFDIEQVSENELKIRIVNAAANFHTPWFAIKNEEPYIFMPAEILDVVFRMLKTAQKESFELKLERSIWQNMPIDFGDVWRVAMDELMKSEFKKEPDLDKLIAKIKREHPNLFVDMSQMLK